MDTEKTLLPIEENLTAEDLQNPETLAKFIVSVLDSKKAREIKLLHVEKQTVIADYFVICTGTSRTQIRSLADEVEFKLKTEDGIEPLRVEGAGSGSWVLVDYGSIIVHVLGVQSKEFYKLEKLWADGTIVPFDKIED